MATRVTVKSQVTLPKAVRDAAGIKPGDRVEVRATTSGAVVIEKARTQEAYKAKLYAIAKRRPLRGLSTDELMELSRGESETLPRRR